MKKNIFFLILLTTIFHERVYTRVFVPQKQYWRYQAFQKPSASTFWAYYTGASSKKAFDCNGKKSRSALAEIFFNKADFVTSDVFPVSNALLGNLPFAPRFSYQEQGVDIGYYGQWKINSKWSWGILAELPIKQIEIKSCQTFASTNTGAIKFFDTALGSVVQATQTATGDQIYNSYAYRLDFLSKLPYACTGVGLEYPMVVYHDTDFENLPLTISNVDITDANNNPVTMLYSTPGTVPAQPFALPQAQATTLAILNTDGSQTGNDTRERVSTGDYRPLSTLPQNQEQWWVVPTLMPVVGGQTTVFPARVIQNHVDEVLGCLVSQAQHVFSNAGINFCSQKQWGAGDLVTQIFVTYLKDWWGFRLRGGVIFPTGKKNCQPRNVFQQPIGNNGHYELQVGSELLMNSEHVSSMIYFLYSHACRQRETVPTPFEGSFIKNIGLPTAADICWDSVTAGILGNFVMGYCSKFNLLVGYQAFVKSHDSICYRKPNEKDVLGNQHQLSAPLLSRKTQQQTHTFQTQLQYNFWRHMRLDSGVEYTFAGKTAPVVFDWNIGLSVLF